MTASHTQKPGDDDNNDNTSSSKASSGKEETKAAKPQASFSETLQFAWDAGPKITWLFALGCVGGVLNGLVYPGLAYLFSSSFADISAASNDGLKQVRELAYTFMIMGVYALVVATVQAWSFEMVAFHASMQFRRQWFAALLKQDQAYYDVKDTGGVAGSVGPAATKYRRGLGRKFGEGIQFLTTGVGGLVYAFFSSWRVAFVVLAVVPFAGVSGLAVLQLNQTKGARAAAAYKTAGSTAYSAVSSIKTVLSLNAIHRMLEAYQAATQEAYEIATGILIKQGFANGSMLGSFMILYCVLTLFGTFLLYRDVEDTGCDPTAGVSNNPDCDNTGVQVFGAMLGVAFAAQGLSQFGNFSEAFSAARVSAHEALQTIRRSPGTPEERIYRSENDDDDIGSTMHSRKSKTSKAETGDPILKAILPKYEIDATSEEGLKPKDIAGRITFDNVHFSYPTRPHETVLSGVSTDIAPGQTVAFVGPSGSGKSTVVAMVERFYDPQSGSVLLDGVNLKDLNVAYYRHKVGYVGQEPTLFACSVKENIKYGNPDATMEEIEEAARLANAHDFVSAFSDGYDTQVGDKGSQLSGGQKQRIAIARVLVGKPSLLILDEATSALDAESELVVQEALDNILEEKQITTIIIAHRLSTIRNCDIINVLVDGTIAESGSHDELMSKEGYYYKLVMKQDRGSGSGSGLSSRKSSEANLKGLDGKPEKKTIDTSLVPHLAFKNCFFSYPSRPKKLIFDDFNLEIERGSTVALCGPSGGGKSTTVGLIERFYDPDQGTVEYQGHDLKELNLFWYRDKIGYVGQEPVLFNDTIANNITYGAPGATRADIIEAAKQANAYDFIMEFEDKFDTQVGERGTQLSGGQKQRVAIARALVKKPEVLLLDEATSALDNESEAIVQAAIDKLLESREHTCIVIAHRLSTIRDADKIALVSDGKVIEQGTHDELIMLPHGRYKRLFDSSRRETTVSTASFKTGLTMDEDKEDEIDWEAQAEEEEVTKFDAKRARQMATVDSFYLLAGSVGAVLAGAVFPAWGLCFSELIDLLFRRVELCESAQNATALGFETCEDYWQDNADEMREGSFVVAGYWVAVLVTIYVGNILTFWGFGIASERLNKRVRDDSFKALLRQEPAYFDKRSVGTITSKLQDDAAKIQAFSGEPVRSFLIALSSIVIGVVLSFAFMWPFALLAIGCIPVMGFATSMEMSRLLGEDEGDLDTKDGKSSPGGIIVETLLNMRTVAALSLEKQRFKEYEKALEKEEPNVVFDSFIGGVTAGLSMFIQQWVNALQMWFGGYLLFTFPDDFQFKDFLISNFAVLFALFGLGAAFQDISDRKEVEKSAGRIFALLDRESAIDPLSESGIKLDAGYEYKKPTNVATTPNKGVVNTTNSPSGMSDKSEVYV